MEIIGYSKSFDKEIQSNYVLQSRFQEMKEFQKSQFSVLYSQMKGFDLINDILARRFLGYQKILDSLRSGSTLFETITKLNFGLTYLLDEAVVEKMRMAPQIYIQGRGSHKTLFDLIEDLNLDLTFDEIMAVDHDVADFTNEVTIRLVGEQSGKDYTHLRTYFMDPTEINWDLYPFKTGIVAPILTSDLFFKERFKSILDALIMDKHDFMNLEMTNGLTVKQNYAYVCACENFLTNSMHEYQVLQDGTVPLYMNTTFSFIGSKWYVKYIFKKYGISYNYDRYESFVNWLVRINYDDPQLTEVDHLHPTFVERIINDIKNKQFFFDYIRFIQKWDLYADQYTLVPNLPGVSGSLSSRLIELIMINKYPLMWFKLFNPYITTYHIFNYFNDYSTDNELLTIESNLVFEEIKNLYNDYFRSDGLENFEEFTKLLNPKPLGKAFLNKFGDTVPFYIYVLDPSFHDKVRSRIIFEHDLFGGARLFRESEIHFDWNKGNENYVFVSTIKLNNNLYSTVNSSHHTYLQIIGGFYQKGYFSTTIDLKSSVYYKLVELTTIDFDYDISWFSPLVLNEYSLDTWDLFVFHTNANDNDPDSPILDNWKVIDPDEHNPDIYNLEYEYPAVEEVTGLTVRGMYTNFRLEVRLWSEGDLGNDLGVVIARNNKLDEANLTVVRSNNDQYTWRLIYNWGMHSEQILEDKSQYVPEYGTEADGTNFWSGNTNGVKIIVERIGDIIKVNTSAWNDLESFNPDSMFVIDLNNSNYPDFDDTLLRIFDNYASIGFSVRNQPKSRFYDAVLTRITEFSM